MIEEVISTEPVQEPTYKKKVYDILSSNFDDFKLGEQDFYKKLSTDKTYAGKVHDVLIENFSDFKKPKNEFIDSLTFVEPVKKKRPNWQFFWRSIFPYRISIIITRL